MKTRAILAVASVSLCVGVSVLAWPPFPRQAPVPQPKPNEPAPASSTPAADADVFKSKISPLLMARCSPCHAPGGKMYARIPFDDEKAVRAHPEGVLKRLKGEDKATLQAWFEKR